MIASAPGRVNLIGEHIDYSGGVVLPMAIPLLARAAVSSGEQPGRVRVHALDLGEDHEADMSTYPRHTPTGHWAHYVLGVVAMIGERHAPLPALDLTVRCDVPSGGGLSSSAAIELATLRALDALLGLGIDPREAALICQQSEHRYAGVPCGLMDQAASSIAQPGQLLALDCASRDAEVIDGIPATRLLVFDTGIRHALGESGYRQRRRAAERGARALGSPLRTLADSGEDIELGGLDRDERDATAHAISEMRRVSAARDAIARGDAETLGRLLIESHRSLRDTLRVSWPEGDALAETLLAVPGLHGARMTGAGFGGCVIALCEDDGATADKAIERAARAHDARLVLTHRWAPRVG